MDADFFPPYSSLRWPSEISNHESKQRVAIQMAESISDGDIIGVGSGTTAFLALCEIGARRIREGLKITAVPTSLEIEWYCRGLGIPLANAAAPITVAFDGADEVDARGRMIKGRGGAMLRERANLDKAARIAILVDRSKLVDRLGSRFRVPVEVDPSEAYSAARAFSSRGLSFLVRLAGSGKDGPVITESGNVLFDVGIPSDTDVEAFDADVRALRGVADTGIFANYKYDLVTPDT